MYFVANKVLFSPNIDVIFQYEYISHETLM